MLENQGSYLVLFRQVLENARRRGPACLRRAAFRQLQAVKEDLAHLLRGGDVELPACDDEDLCRQVRQLLRQLAPGFRQALDVKPDAGTLHPREQAHQRHLDIREKPAHSGGVEVAQEPRFQLRRRQGLHTSSRPPAGKALALLGLCIRQLPAQILRRP